MTCAVALAPAASVAKVHAAVSVPLKSDEIRQPNCPPIAAEFSLCYEQQNLGMSAEDSMRDLAKRNGLLEIKIFVLAMLVQQQTGGNLAELLDNLATVVRERFRLRGKIKTLTAEGRFQAIVLLALPLFMLTLIMVLNRAYGQVLLDNPNLLVAMLVMDANLAKSEGHEPLGYVRAYAYAGLDPARMGLGPVYAIDQLLRRANCPRVLDLGANIGLFGVFMRGAYPGVHLTAIEPDPSNFALYSAAPRQNAVRTAGSCWKPAPAITTAPSTSPQVSSLTHTC